MEIKAPSAPPLAHAHPRVLAPMMVFGVAIMKAS